MGVLGFTPFIQKTCPEVIKYFPDRLKAFAGKRIVFDGTLITQRLHFAPYPHPYRHIIGWYRLIKELEKYDVQAICVFDGKERSTAKAREHIRRKEALRLAAARGFIEDERLKRLNQLHGVLGQMSQLNPSERLQLSIHLQHEIGQQQPIPIYPDFSDPFWSQHISSVPFSNNDIIDTTDFDQVHFRTLYHEAEKRFGAVSEEEEAFYQDLDSSSVSNEPEPDSSTYNSISNAAEPEVISKVEHVSIAPQVEPVPEDVDIPAKNPETLSISSEDFPLSVSTTLQQPSLPTSQEKLSLPSQSHPTPELSQTLTELSKTLTVLSEALTELSETLPKLETRITEQAADTSPEPIPSPPTPETQTAAHISPEFSETPTTLATPITEQAVDTSPEPIPSPPTPQTQTAADISAELSETLETPIMEQAVDASPEPIPSSPTPETQTAADISPELSETLTKLEAQITEEAIETSPEIISRPPTPKVDPAPPTETQPLQTNDGEKPLINRLASALSSLYLEYRHSVSKISSIPLSSEPVAGAGAGTVVNEGEQEEAKTEYDMSRRQYKLTLEEGEVWNRITGVIPDVIIDDAGAASKSLNIPSLDWGAVSTEGEKEDVAVPEPESASVSDTMTPEEEALISLTKKSSSMSESYKRSADVPTTKTYDESKEILAALGVPCIEATGAYEAEAVAASLVLNGYADYVASEDTDVLVYEAPLIRNITNRNAPLLVVSGAEVRDVLQLTRPMYIDFALLLGTDFSQRIKNVGPSRALKFIRAHGSIEKVIEEESKFSPRVPKEDYMMQVVAGRAVYGTLPPITKEIVDGMRLGGAGEGDDGSAKARFVMEKYGLSRILEWNWEEGLEGNYFGDGLNSGPSGGYFGDNPSSGGNW